MAKHHFETEVTQLLNLMIHSLYSNKEIFLRELISNASDALDKLNYLTLTDEKFKNLKYEPKIVIKTDKKNKKLTVSDTGIGMDEADLVENLGTIARSGTKSFLEKLSGDAKKDSSLIGQFGVGFYSAFMVAKKIEVLTKKAGDDKAWLWRSEGGEEYEIEEAEKDEHGTDIILHIREEDEEFLEPYRIESIVQKYSNHIAFPIYLEEIDEKEKKEPRQINKASALWRLPKNEISEEEYKDFYKQISHDSNDPFLWIHTKAEGTIEYTTLFYIPSEPPLDLYRVDYQSGVKLYVKRVFITDDDKELLPTYLRFVRGIIDVEDIPLNISREMLQQNTILAKVKKASTKKILTELKKLKEKDREKYIEFYKKFGKVLKEGLYNDFENRDLILDLLLFKSSKREGYIDLNEYKENMKEDQKAIYYITGEDENLLRNSPLIEKFKAKEIEVLLLDEEVDTIVMPMVPSYKEIPFKPVTTTEVDEDLKEEISEEEEKKYKELVVKMKEILKDEVKDVKISTRLSESPACLVFDKEDPDYQMQMMLKQMGQTELPKVKPILEINPKHDIFNKILLKNDFSPLYDIAYIVLDEAKLSEGMKIEDVTEFTKRINKLLSKAL